MASLRNAIPQRPYRERDQPHSRSRHGLLEKHKDYSARARDYNAKKSRLKLLRQKATERNEDEFHFGMMSSKTKGGVKITERGNKALSNDAVKLLKTQDAGYLRTMISRTRKERERLESEIQILELKPGGETRLRVLKDDDAGGKHGQHTVFVGNEAEQQTFDPEDWFQTDEQGMSQSYNRPRKSSRIENASSDQDAQPAPTSQRERDFRSGAWKDARASHKRIERGHDQMRARLDALKTREQELVAAEVELDLQRAKMNHSLGGVNKNGVKYKIRERKR